ncbi:MAG: type II secretion system F family protein [Mycobacterium leprae]
MPTGLSAIVGILFSLSLGSLAFDLACRFTARLTPISDRVSAWVRSGQPSTWSSHRRSFLAPLQYMLAEAHLPLNPLVLVLLMLWSGLLGVRLVSILANPPLSVSVFGTTALLPLVLVRHRMTAIRLKVMKALGPALVQLTKVADVRRHPFLALQDTVPVMDQPLRGEFERALQDYEAGAALSEALRRAAERLSHNPYLYQLAEIVDLSLNAGASFSEALFRLLARYRQSEELQAEEQTNMKGYSWLTLVFYIGSLLPLAYWVLRDPGSIASYQTTVARWLVVWSYLSGLVIVILPRLFSLEEV